MAIALTTNSVAYHSARRSPNAPVDVLSTEDITDAPHGVQQLALERLVDLVAQTAHQHVDDVGLRIECVLPDVRQDHRLGDDATGVAHQVFEQAELARPQLDRTAVAAH